MAASLPGTINITKNYGIGFYNQNWLSMPGSTVESANHDAFSAAQEAADGAIGSNVEDITWSSRRVPSP
jgi:hypothetical protein